jgi:uncharacterized membrane protein YjgN (DUF898 family)
VRKFLYRHTTIGTSSLDYDGTGGAIFRPVPQRHLYFTIVTFGIYVSWFKAEVANYHTNHTLFQGNHMKGVIDGAEIFVANLLGQMFTFITLGIFIPWWIIRLQRVMIQAFS